MIITQWLNATGDSMIQHFWLSYLIIITKF